MRHFYFFILAIFSCSTIWSQNAYIQVNGEPDLSVYLNNQFKGKTTVELNGYIIENVKPGSNLIKIVKEGYAPYEEAITVKPGEVLSYKVKPFAKHKVTFTEQGTTKTTEKKAEIQTGQLLIQSVPIEIKITIPDIEGAENIQKTKDEWIADKVPSGNYKIIFTFNNKKIEKYVDIVPNEKTSLFVNMINGDFTIKNTLQEKQLLQKQIDFFNSFMKRYKYKPNVLLDEFLVYNPEASFLLEYPWGKSGYTYWLPLKQKLKMIPCPTKLDISNVNKSDPRYVFYVYSVIITKDYNLAKNKFDLLVKEFQDNVDPKYLSFSNDGRDLNIWYIPNTIGRISIELANYEKGWYEVEINFMKE